MASEQNILVYGTWILPSAHKRKKIKTKNKELQHWNSDWQFGGFYTWLTKGSVEGSAWLVESEDLDFRATPLDVEMTPWVS